MNITQTIANDLVLDIEWAHASHTSNLESAGAPRPERELIGLSAITQAAQTTRATDCLSLWVEGSYEGDGEATYERNRRRLQVIAKLIYGGRPSDSLLAYRQLNSFVIEQFTGLTASEYNCSRSTAQRGVVRAFDIIAERHGGNARELLDFFNAALGQRLIDSVWEDLLREEQTFPAYAAI